MDGTLFRSEAVAVPSFRTAFAKMADDGVDIPKHLTDDQITGTFGYTHDHIWHTLLGRNLEPDKQEKGDQWVLDAEISLLEEGAGALFDGVVETLTLLHNEGAALAVASNGQRSYIEAIIHTFHLTPLFSGLYSASGYKMRSKVDLVRLILSEIPYHKAVMIGDRSSDVEAGKENGLPAIGCAFGFADARELHEADFVVRQFADIVKFSL